jgi:hypothetical protein
MRYLLILLTVLWLFSFKHPFYLSVTNLKYNKKEAALQGTVKVFLNDFESALKKINQKTIDLIRIKDTADVNKKLIVYLKTHLSLKLNGKERSFNFIGFEQEDDAFWMYIEFKKCETPKKIEINNSILYDFLSEQTNIVSVEVDVNKKSSKASYPDRAFVFDF